MEACTHTKIRFGADWVEPDPDRGVQFFERAIREKNSTTAMVNFASWLLSTDGSVPRDAKRGIHLYERAIEEGS